MVDGWPRAFKSAGVLFVIYPMANVTIWRHVKHFWLCVLWVIWFFNRSLGSIGCPGLPNTTSQVSSVSQNHLGISEIATCHMVMLPMVGLRRGLHGVRYKEMACRDGYSSSNTILQPAANHAKRSNRKTVRGVVVMCDFLGILGTESHERSSKHAF